MARRNTRLDVFKNIDMTGGPDTCHPWKLAPGAGKGRGKPRPYHSVNGVKYLAYRIVYELTSGETLTEDDIMRHSCDNSLCCNFKHLTKGTHDENMEDMVESDRHGLPSHVVRRIRTLLTRGNMTHEEIGELYAVSRSVVTRISNDQLHTHANDYPKEGDDAE